MTWLEFRGGAVGGKLGVKEKELYMRWEKGEWDEGTGRNWGKTLYNIM